MLVATRRAVPPALRIPRCRTIRPLHRVALRLKHLGEGSSMGDPAGTSELASLLMTRSLRDAELLRASGEAPDYAILPEGSVLKIGGQSLIDRGAAAVLPLVGAAVARQNAHMRADLMARHGIPVVGGSAFGALALYLSECGAAIFSGMPPYDLWQHVPSEGVIPPYRTDAGCYLVAEVYGAKNMIFVKDEDGLCTANPKTDPDAKLIPKVTVDELDGMDLPDLIIDRPVLDPMRNAPHLTSAPVIN